MISSADRELKEALLTLCTAQKASIQLIRDLQISLSVLQSSVAPMGSDPAFRLNDKFQQIKKDPQYDPARIDELKRTSAQSLLALDAIIQRLK